MTYTIIYTNENGEQRIVQINALNAKAAHEQAGQNANGESVRVYPTTQDKQGNINSYGVLRGALLIAKRSAEKTLARTGGTDTQQRIATELIGANAKAGADGAEQLGESYILDIVARLSADSKDMFSCAYDGILTAISDGEDIGEQYHSGYLAVNAHIMAQRSATQHEISNEFVEAQGGTLVAISSYIARLIKSGERYTPIGSDEMDAETADRLGEALKGAAAMLTPRQKNIAALIGRGYSQRQTADKLNIKNVATVNEHLTRIRKIYLEYITENAPEFLYIIKGEQVSETHTIRKADRHANTEERRKANAEKQRRYRERKKAEKNA